MTPGEQTQRAAQILEASASQFRRWREEPVTFVRECIGVEPDAWQAEMLNAFPRHNRLVASACKGPGKTAALAWLGWNFLLTRPHCKVPCTSITGANLEDGLWTEFAKWRNRSPILQRAFEWNKTRIVAKQHPETWWASARSWARDGDKQQQANTLAGLHEDYLLFLIDEVSEIPDGVVSAAEAALTGGVETKLVMMGNPTRTDGPLWRAVRTDRHLWHVTRITGDPDDPNRSPRIDKEEARRQIEKYGRDSYVVRVNILGEFPLRQADKLIDIADCEAAMQRVLPESVLAGEPKILGADVARYGDDDSTLSPRQGRIGFRSREFHGLDTVEFGEQIIKALLKWDADGVFVDATGLGVGSLDHCRHRGFGHIVQGINFGARATEDTRFENKRTEMYWRAAEWLKMGCLPRDPMLAEELSAPIYWYDKKGRICLEPKDDIKARIGRSPDKADGFALTFAGYVRPKSRGYALPSEQAAAQTQHEHDPFAEA